MSNRSQRGAEEAVSVSGVKTLPAVNARTFRTSGVSTVEDGVKAERMDVSGATTVRGSVEAIEFDLSGSADVGGAFDVKVADTSGALDVRGPARIHTFDTSGSSEFAALRAGEVSNSGALEVDTLQAESVTTTGVLETDELVADEVETSGVLEADTVEAGTFRSTGALTIDGLHADEVRIRVGNADVTVDEIEGTEVRIERAKNGGGLLSKFRDPGEFRADRVAGETVFIEDGRVDVVEGERVTLGPGAEVDVLRADDANVDPDATVGSQEPRSNNA